jgi:hypothetical protein
LSSCDKIVIFAAVMRKMKFLFLMILLQMMPIVCMLAKNRAFLVGIGSYPPESGWHFIHAADDIALMEKPLKRQGYVHHKIGRRKGNKKQYREWAETSY